MRTFFDLLIMFMMLMVLAACSAANPTSDTTLIPTLFPQLSSELEDLERPSTVTARPSSTPLPSATADQTQTAIYQTIASTQSAEQTLLARFPRICRDNYALGSFSPNSLWMEEFCYSEDDGSPILTLSNKDTKALWKLLYRDYVDFMPDGGMSVVHWSDDGQYAYFNSYLATSGGYCFMGGNVLNHGTGLFRVDLDSGSTSTILPRRENFAGYSFSFSPTGRRLVYEPTSSGVKVLDLKTGQLINVSLAGEFSEAGGYLWSPDGLQFVYSTVLSVVGDIANYSIRLADSRSGNEKILLESPENCFVARTWVDDNIITTESYDKNYDRTLIEYDLDSNVIISESTATPRP